MTKQSRPFQLSLLRKVTALSDSNPTSKPDLYTKPSSSNTVLTKEETKTRPAEQEHPATSSTANIETVQLDNVPEPVKEFLGVEPPAKKRKRVYKFNDDWLLLSSFCKWLEKKEEKDKEPTAFCKLCEVTIANHKPVLERHMTTTKHQTNANAIQHTKHIGDLIKKTSGTSRDQARRAEVKFTVFLAEHNLPLSLADSLVPFVRNTFPDSTIAREMSLGRTKATDVLAKVVAPACRFELITHLKTPGNFFSLVMDETTDVSTTKQCALSVIFFNNDTEIVETRFFYLYEADSGKAENLCEAMLLRLKNNSIPLENVVGFASDTTNSMVGQHNSVFSHLKKSIPDITCVKCSCHMIHLVASKACSTLPSSIEDLLRNIGAHFSRSSKRVSRLQECQEFYGVEIHKILSPANTRWLSLKACVDRTLEQYVVLTEYFRLEMFEDGTSVNVRIYEGLENKLTKVYLEFLSYILEFLTDFNKLFQTDKPLLHCLQPEIEKLIRSIASNYMQLNHVKNIKPLLIDHANPGHFMPLEKIYLGVLAQDSVIQILQDQPTALPDVTNLRRRCLTFYIELIKQIKDRFDFNDPVFNTISILDPKVAQSFERQDLSEMLNRYPVLKSVVDEPALYKEWREHALLDHEKLKLDPTLTATSYWNMVFKLRNMNEDPLFPNLKKVICLLLVLPFSNASVERIFSQLKLIKTDNRNRLNTNTISALMMTKQSIKDSIKYEPPKSLLISSNWKFKQ